MKPEFTVKPMNNINRKYKLFMFFYIKEKK